MSTSAWISRLGIHYLILACFVCATGKKIKIECFLALEGLQRVRRYRVLIVTFAVAKTKEVTNIGNRNDDDFICSVFLWGQI